MTSTPKNFGELVDVFTGIIDLLIPLIFAVTLVVVIWKVIDVWVIHTGDETKVKEGKQIVLVAVIGLVIMSGIWGIISILKTSIFGL